MSNYTAPAFHPKSGQITDATWIDNYFGPHIYGVRFDDDDKIYKSIECAMEAAGAELARLTEQCEQMKKALEFYRDPFAWKKQHDPGNDVQIPDFYSETSFGDTVEVALSHQQFSQEK